MIEIQLESQSARSSSTQRLGLQLAVSDLGRPESGLESKSSDPYWAWVEGPNQALTLKIHCSVYVYAYDMYDHTSGIWIYHIWD